MSKKHNTTAEDPKKKTKSNVADDGPRRSFSTSNNATNGLKRPLVGEMVRTSGRKKLRTTINSNDKQGSTNEKTIDKYSQDSNETLKNDNKKNKNEKIDNISKNLKANSPAKKNICIEISKNEPSSTNKKTTQKKNDPESVKNSKIINENRLSLKNGSPSDKLVIVEYSDHHEDIDNNYKSSGKLSSAVYSSTKTDNLNKINTKKSEVQNIKNTKDHSVLNNDKNLIDILEPSKNVESIIMIESSNHNTDQAIKPKVHDINVSPNTNKFFDEVSESNDDEIIDVDNSFNLSCNNIKEHNDDLFNDIVNGTKKLNEHNFPFYMKMFKGKKWTYEEFEALCSVKVIEYLSEVSDRGKERTDIKILLEREQFWRKKYASLTKQMREIKAVVKLHNNELKTNKNAKPHLVQRTVGLQAVICTRKEATTNIPIPTADVPPQTVDITNDDSGHAIDITNNDNSTMEITNDQSPVEVLSDSDDVTSSVPETPIPSTSKAKECTTPNKHVPSTSSVLTLSPIVLKKAVPPAVPINSLNKVIINNCATIDLTNDDGIEVSNAYTLDSKSPIKLVHTPGSSSSKQLPNNMSPQVLSKSLGFIDLSQPSSGYIVRTNAGAKGPTQLGSVSSLNPSNQTGNQSYLVRSGSILPIHVGTRQLQPGTVTYSTRQLPSQHNGTLQPVPPAISIMNKHPAPLPEMPNQRSLPSWKKLPPAPKVTITKTTQSQRALVLSWNMPVSNKAVADVSSYQIYAYHEVVNEPAKTELWKKIGDVNALPLPMACSLTQFRPGEKYHFAIRAVDTYHRIGPFSDPQNVYLTYS